MNTQKTRDRRGAVLVVVLVCLIMISLMSVTLLRQGFSARGLVRSEERRLQATWLAESGLERAAARLASEADYTGETWNLSPDEVGGSWPGKVAIAVTLVEGHPKQRRVDVVADYPAEATLKTRKRSHTLIELSSVPSGETQ